MAFQDFDLMQERRRQDRARRLKKRLIIGGVTTLIVLLILGGCAFAIMSMKNGGSSSSKEKEEPASPKDTSENKKSPEHKKEPPAEGKSKPPKQEEAPAPPAGEGPAITTGAKSQSQLVVSACNTTLYKEACERSMENATKDNPNPQPKDVIKSAISVASEGLDTAFANASKLSFNTPEEKQGLTVCQEVVADAKAELQASMDRLDKKDATNLSDPDVLNWMSAVMSYQEACVDAFPEGKLRSDVQLALNSSQELTSNSLAMMEQMSMFSSLAGAAGDAIAKATEAAAAARHLLGSDGLPKWMSIEGRRFLKEDDDEKDDDKDDNKKDDDKDDDKKDDDKKDDDKDDDKKDDDNKDDDKDDDKKDGDKKDDDKNDDKKNDDKKDDDKDEGKKKDDEDEDKKDKNKKGDESKGDDDKKDDDDKPKEDGITPQGDDVVPKVDDIMPKEVDDIPKESNIIPKELEVMPKEPEILPKDDGVKPKSDGDDKVKAPKGPPPNVTVAQDGSGQFKTISEALAKIPETYEGRYVIYVKAGIYEESVNVTKKMENLTMYGDGSQKSIITGSKNAIDGIPTYLTATFVVAGDGFFGKGMGFRNTAGPEKHQAVAARVQADKCVFLQCRFEGFQDTLYVQAHRQFYRSCVIIGTIDFIFGDAAAVFQNCEIQVRKPLDNQENIITAQGRRDKFETTAIVLQNCEIMPHPELLPVKAQFKTYLGRPWKEFSRTVVMESKIEDLVDPAGWKEWNGTFALDTLFYGEFNNNGPGANTVRRVKWAGRKDLSPDEAAQFSVGQLLQGDWIGPTGVIVRMGLGGTVP